MSDIPQPCSWPSCFQRVLLIGSGAIGVALSPGWIALLKAWYQIDIRVILTHSADLMVSRQIIGALSKHHVSGPDWDLDSSSVEHRELADWADLVIVAPATANYITKLAQGNLDSLALYVPVLANVPVLIIPSMPDRVISYPPVAKALLDLNEYENMYVVETTTGLSAHSLQPSIGGLINIIDIVKYINYKFGKDV
jgi:DNA/pantothenate metabolism flavoprotein